MKAVHWFNKQRYLSAVLITGGILPLSWPLAGADAENSTSSDFELKVRPLLLSQCVKCHGPEKQKGGLRLDSGEGLSKGGQLGVVVVPGDPDASLLIKAVRRIGDLEMPPKSKLTDEQVEVLVDWVKKGAIWPDALPLGIKTGATDAKDKLAPDDPALVGNLQVWLRADTLPLNDSAKVFRWPDSSGHYRDAAPTLGAFDGTGLPPTFARSSAVNGRPAVHFDTNSALATPGDRPLDINGDAEYTIIVVANLKPNGRPNEPGVIVGFGEPVDGSNASPGRPSAGLLQIGPGPIERQWLDHAGGFGLDAGLSRPGSFAPFYETSLIISLTKTPGPMRDSSSIFVNGEPVDDLPASGSSAVPEIRQRKDFGLLLGHALRQTGSMLGDISEVLLYNVALSPGTRQKLEKGLSAKYGIEVGGPANNVYLAEKLNEKARQHWAFRKPHRPNPPNVRAKNKVNTPIDAFILAKLEEKNLTLSPPANEATLVRRACLDLIGLPPSLEQLREYATDASARTYARLLDQLLDSPHFGERWGRHWLDMAGYVDVTGNDQNAEQIILGQTKWKYRDYVIRAFNQDKPFDRFVTEQMAGDEMVDWRNAEKFTSGIKDLLIATGYLRTAIDDTHEVDLNKPGFRYQVLFDTVQIVGNGLLGLTIQCCRCHDHKYDPMTQRDYYRLMSLFTPALNPAAWLQPKDRELADVSPSEKTWIDKYNADLDYRAKPIEEKVAATRADVRKRLFEARLAAVPETERADTKKAFEIASEKRSDAQKELARKFDSQLSVSTNDIEKALSVEQRAEIENLNQQLTQLNQQRTNYGTIRAFFETGPPPRGYIFVRGDFEHPAERVNPGFINALCASPEDVVLPRHTHAAATSTERRLAFARWLTNTNEYAAGLVARVWVNRMWQQLFGEGLVPTPDNFGFAGLPPTHPELLDWLITEFITSGWRVKPLLKLMMMSNVYRQTSAATSFRTRNSNRDVDPMTADPDNHLLWHMRLRRLESEIIRDSILAVSGKLDLTAGGPAVPVDTTPDGFCSFPQDEKLPSASSKWRRTVYLMSRRNFHLPILSSFDQPIINSACTRRVSSSVVSQSLTMLNDGFVLEQSGYLADLVSRKAPNHNNPGRVNFLFETALGRRPSSDELVWSLKFLEDQSKNHKTADVPAEKSEREALVNLCQMVMNTSEFLYQN